MNSSDVKIIADSSADICSFSDIALGVVPFKIITAEKEYIDTADFDVRGMVEELSLYKGRSSTSCPNAEDWLDVFGDARCVFCVTITSGLSGSYNTACLAREMYEEKHPDRRVFVIDTLSAGPEIKLLIEKITELVKGGADFNEVCQKAREYQKNTGLLFMLESMKNLANNGRVSPITAKAAGLLGIRVVGRASDDGVLEPLHKCRGEDKALSTIVKELRRLGFWGGKLRIAHCFNENAAKELSRRISSEFINADIEIYKCRALCSFYAEQGGMLIGFEKN